MYDMIAKGGVLMWPLLACSVLAIAIVVDRFLVVRAARRNVAAVCRAAAAALLEGDEAAARAPCERSPGPAATVLLGVIEALSGGRIHAEGVASRLGSRVTGEAAFGALVCAFASGWRCRISAVQASILADDPEIVSTC